MRCNFLRPSGLVWDAGLGCCSPQLIIIHLVYFLSYRAAGNRERPLNSLSITLLPPFQTACRCCSS